MSGARRYWTEAWCLNSPENRESIDDTEVVLASDYDAQLERYDALHDERHALARRLDALVAERDAAVASNEFLVAERAKLRAVVEAAKAFDVGCWFKEACGECRNCKLNAALRGEEGKRG